MKKVLLWSATLVLALDQVTKVVIVFWMDLISKGQIDIWPGFIHFHMAWNTGINFGLFSDQGDLMRWLLIAVALVVCGFVGYWMRHEQKPIALISAGSVIGGALGNSLDRALHGSVADFLNVTCCGFYNPYAFNVADIAIFVGLFGLVIFSTDHKNS
jgi:signal peptidase II|tara:strand:+ start:2437 stop:2907 length:471 start_codon:yes stop_codon:yes gene_type:complete